MLVAIFVSLWLGNDEPQDLPRKPVIVSAGRDPELFAKYTENFKITPERAAGRAKRYYHNLVDDPKRPLGELRGVVDNEYHFSPRGKKTFGLAGYRVNVHTGRVRYVGVDDLHKQYGRNYRPTGIPNGELPDYLPESLKPPPPPSLISQLKKVGEVYRRQIEEQQLRDRASEATSISSAARCLTDTQAPVVIGD